MKPWPSKAALLVAGVAAAALLAPALLQAQEAPESLLPPGFGETPAPLPPPATPSPSPGAPAPVPLVPANPAPPPAPAPGLPSLGGEGVAVADLSEEEIAALEALLPKPVEIPDFARRSPEVVGVLTEGAGGLGYEAWGNVNGVFLSTLMRRTEAPLPSRWASMLLRRALLSRVPAPALVNPVDWVAERAWLLLRMGEADAARMLVQSVDVDQFTPKMMQVAVQSALANSDPAALCPLVEPGQKMSREPIWPLAAAICSALRGDASEASSQIARARRGSLDAIDVSLAEKVVGAGANSRRSATIEWEGVDRLTSWRFGLSTATGMQLPDRMFEGASPRLRAWQARAPMVPIGQRLAAADVAASLGVFSNRSLVDIYSGIADSSEPAEDAEAIAQQLRTAYVGRTAGDRLGALRALWGERSGDETRRHARSILTAVAASRIRPNAEAADEVDRLVGSMLSAGLDEKAAAWTPIVEAADGAAADRAWAMLAVSAPATGLSISEARIDAFDAAMSGDGRAGRLLVAALAGLGKVRDTAAADLAEANGIDLEARNPWTTMLAQAADKGQQGTVALLAAAGMQTASWRGVPASHLYNILRALRQVGLEYEARMIAAEAVRRA